jgi:hypothetical protein
MGPRRRVHNAVDESVMMCVNSSQESHNGRIAMTLTGVVLWRVEKLESWAQWRNA